MITNEVYEQEAFQLASHYYINSDKAHMLDHIELVKRRAYDMWKWYKDKYDVEANLKLILIAATFHDIGSCIQREDHHKYSNKIFLTDDKINKSFDLSISDKVIISNAILQHSSHFSGNYFSLEAQILASADRDEPDIYNILKRSVDYGKEYNPDDVVESVAKYNIKRYGTRPSSDYRVPEWHFEYWNETIPNAMDNLIKFFANEKIVKKVCEDILYEVKEDVVRKTIYDFLIKGEEVPPSSRIANFFRNFRKER